MTHCSSDAHDDTLGGGLLVFYQTKVQIYNEVQRLQRDYTNS